MTAPARSTSPLCSAPDCPAAPVAGSAFCDRHTDVEQPRPVAAEAVAA